jgi:chorismate synthase
MAGNSFGQAFRFTTWGESHGPAIGCVVDGVPPKIALAESDIQPWLDRRAPGKSRFTTQRREPDQVRILSGVFEGETTGAPIALVIDNVDQRSKDYGDIVDTFRPGHADYTYWKKYGLRDHHGGGRASARETAMRVAAGAIARKILDHLLDEPVVIRGALIQIASLEVDRERWDWDEVERNPFCAPDPEIVGTWSAFLDKVRKDGSSAGAVIEVMAEGVPPGLGEPAYDKLDADLAKAMMSINAVKGVEVGGRQRRRDAHERRPGRLPQQPGRRRAGRHLDRPGPGGPLRREADQLDPEPSSILSPRKTVTKGGEETEVSTKGRHDPCVGIRAVPVGEAMMAVVLADHLLRHRGQCGL